MTSRERKFFPQLKTYLCIHPQLHTHRPDKMYSASAVSHILLSWISVQQSSLDRSREMTSHFSCVWWTSLNPPRSCELRSCVALWHEQCCTYWSVTVVGQPARLEPVGGERVPAVGDYPQTQFHNFTTALRRQEPVTRVTSRNFYVECAQ
jgi:hypothetical protein